MDLIINLNQVDIPNKKDEIIERPNYKLVVSNESILHLLGTKIDWKTVMGESFHLKIQWRKQNVDVEHHLQVKYII